MIVVYVFSFLVKQLLQMFTVSASVVKYVVFIFRWKPILYLANYFFETYVVPTLFILQTDAIRCCDGF